MIFLSIVIPVYQAENIIDELIHQLTTNIDSITNKFEIILVDDSSLDNSWPMIEKNCKKDNRIKGIKLSRNFGQHIAITAGLDFAAGEWTVIMDCDLQDQPKEIIKLYKKAIEGWDIVLASRIVRKDRFTKRFFSKLFYSFLSFLSGTQYDYTLANFGIYNKKVIEAILKMHDSIRYTPALINWVGFKKTKIAVEHDLRFNGNSTYTFNKSLKLAFNTILAYSDKPLKLIVKLGFSIALTAFFFALVIIYKTLKGQIPVMGYPSLIISLSFFSGIIIMVIGVLGLYIGKIFEGIKNRPLYLITKKINS